MRKILLTLLFAGAVLNAAAQRPRTRVEWGVVGGINIPDYSTNMDATDVKNKLGWQAGIVTAINLGAFAVEPQILYVRQGLRIRPEGEGAPPLGFLIYGNAKRDANFFRRAGPSSCHRTVPRPVSSCGTCFCR